MNPHLDAIRDPATKSGDLVRHLAGLDTSPTAEPPSFWNEIGGDARYRPGYRAVAIIQLFRRHFSPGASLSLLSGATWLDRSSLTLVDAPPAKLALAFDPADTVVLLRPVADIMDDMTGLYLRIAGRWTRDQIAAALASPSASQTVRAWALLDRFGTDLAHSS